MAYDRSTFHSLADHAATRDYVRSAEPITIFTFWPFYHPFVGDLIRRLNDGSLPGLLDPRFHESLAEKDPGSGRDSLFRVFDEYNLPRDDDDLSRVRVRSEGIPRQIDVSPGGPYANYNWELLFHIPLMIAVHLSKNQRFAEAQRWFHFIFDPTSTEPTTPQRRYWRFIAFRSGELPMSIDALLALLSKPDPTEADLKLKEQIESGYFALRNKPFQPHVVARTRHVAYQYSAVMKYLDNLIAWGDTLFRQDTVETINEATQLYILAANVLGPRPQRIPAPGRIPAKTYMQIRGQTDILGNLLVELESKFPFNLSMTRMRGADPVAARQLFGIGQSLFFCIPRNDKLLSYWDLVADRLFKIRHCMNIEGIVRQLALFDPPLDPGMLVKAVAAGIDVAAAVSGLSQPVGQLRAPFLIEKALAICGEVRGLGSALLAAIEKGDGEHISLLRQQHEIKIQEMQREVRVLQWKQAHEATEFLLDGRAGVLERYRFYLRLLGRSIDETAPEKLTPDRRELTEQNFDKMHAELVKKYSAAVTAPAYPPMGVSLQFFEESAGNLHLLSSEDAELNKHLPRARDQRVESSDLRTIAAVLTFIPDFGAKVAPIGIGIDTLVFGGGKLADALKIKADMVATESTREQDQAGIASRTASYERRTDEWILQARTAARELEHIGRQIIGSLIAEQVARREILNIEEQLRQSRGMEQVLRDKFTNEELYGWMQGEISRLYYEYYRFAFDVARKAEQTAKRELMSPELDATDYVKLNYWDGGRKGLLSGEALYLDIKRLELAYHEHNKREYELTKHVSLLQVNPYALLQLRAVGRCTVYLPEELFDVDGPGHYFRRIKSVAVSIPCVTGPYTSVNCRLTLLRSSIRKSALLRDGGYKRAGAEDDRFVDYFGSLQSVVASSAQHDAGMFETNMRDERYLPFEGSGAVGEWQLELPADPSKADEFPQFDYGTIADAILHLRFTAREAGGGLRAQAVKNLNDLTETSGSTRLFSIRHEFASEWAKIRKGDIASVSLDLRAEHYPFWCQGRIAEATIKQVDLIGNSSDTFTIIGQNDAPRDAVKDTALGLYTFRFPKDELPSKPVGAFNLTLGDGDRLKDAWLAVTWTHRSASPDP